MGRHRPFLHRGRPVFQLVALMVGVSLLGCGGGGPIQLPPPRPIIVSSGGSGSGWTRPGWTRSTHG